MAKFKKISFLFWVIITIIPIVGVVISLTDTATFQQSQETIRNKLLFFGIFAPLAFIVLQILQVVITPISHYSVGIAGGFLFGPFWGTFYNWIGRVIGHAIAFQLARKYGRKITHRFVEQKTLDKYDKYVSNKSFLLFLMFALPLFPDDELSYLTGLSKMRFSAFMAASIFGHLGGSLALAYIGSGINTKDFLFWFLIVTALLGFILVWFLMKRKSANYLEASQNMKRPDSNF